jgi:Zn finger protein HypA/HybF involved in hydrogenase expression
MLLKTYSSQNQLNNCRLEKIIKGMFGSNTMPAKICNTCKQEFDELEFVGNQCKQCHSDYLESLGGEDQYSS